MKFYFLNFPAHLGSWPWDKYYLEFTRFEKHPTVEYWLEIYYILN